MHPDVCGFILEQIYEGRLTSEPTCARQNTVAGTGPCDGFPPNGDNNVIRLEKRIIVAEVFGL